MLYKYAIVVAVIKKTEEGGQRKLGGTATAQRTTLFIIVS